MSAIYQLDINPMPWTPGTAVSSAGRGGKGRFTRMIKDPQLEFYQEAVREEMFRLYPDIVRYPKTVNLRLIFGFWRQLERASDAEGRKHRAKRADATNLQKALEDALQGVLYDNDTSVIDIRTMIHDQHEDTTPKIAIIIEEIP